jgi:histidine triad (HIT) family protein
LIPYKGGNIMEDCIFCRIVKGEIPCFKVYENESVLAFEDINPVADGHTLIIPRIHAENIWEISEEDLTAIHIASRKIIQGIRDALKPTGVAVLQLNGKGANQEVMHYHLHLIPRSEGAPALPMTKWKLKQGDMAKIKLISNQIASAIRT